MADANIWNPGAGVLNVDAESTNYSEAFTATTSQTVFTLTQFTYTVGSSSLAVYYNGQRIVKNIDWLESTSSSFTLLFAAKAGAIVEAVAVLGTITSMAAQATADAAQAHIDAAQVAADKITVAANTVTCTNAAATSSSAASTASSAASTASAAQTTASAAAITATNAAGLAAGYLVPVTSTSSTSLAVTTGAKSLTTETGRAYVPGHNIKIARTSAASTTYMTGTVDSYNSSTGAMTATVASVGGTGTFTDWTISISSSNTTTAGSTSFTPSGALAATNVQAALQELDSEKAPITSGTAVLKGNGSGGTATAVAGTDYLAPPSGSAILKANAGGALANAVAGTDYLAPAAIGSTVQAYDAQLFSNIPQNSKSAAYTCVASDAQKHIFHPSADTTARTITIPANASVAYPIGTAITFVNQNGAGVLTIAITSDVMRLGGVGTTGNRSLAANGIATALKITATEWIISGTGLT